MSDLITKKLFNLNVVPDPALDFRVALGKDGQLSINIPLSDFITLITSNLEVYTIDQINDLLLNFLAKTNLTPYTPTQQYHPATKKYVDESVSGVVNNSLGQGWTGLFGEYRLQWFKFTSNIDGDQTVPFPYPFPNACVNVILGSNAETNTDLVITKDDFIFNRDDAINEARVVYVHAIGY